MILFRIIQHCIAWNIMINYRITQFCIIQLRLQIKLDILITTDKCKKQNGLKCL